MIGEKIREIRQSQGRSLAEIAGKANISVATLSRIETDKQAIDVALLLGLVEILGVAAADVLGQAGSNGDPLAHRIASLGAKQRTDLWREVAAERRTQRSRKSMAGNFAQQVEEMLAQLDFVREELEALRAKAKKKR